MCKDNIVKFGEELERTVDYFRQEYDLTYAAAIGMLEIVKQKLVLEVIEAVQDKEEEENDA